jgi:TRAP-type C4-dicarboxylate transport system substrate-binding protein
MPIDIQEIILKNVKKFVDQQREYTVNLNRNLSETLQNKGMVINVADTSTFRNHLGKSFYQKWKNEVGDHAWNLLEDQVGKLV